MVYNKYIYGNEKKKYFDIFGKRRIIMFRCTKKSYIYNQLNDENRRV